MYLMILFRSIITGSSKFTTRNIRNIRDLRCQRNHPLDNTISVGVLAGALISSYVMTALSIRKNKTDNRQTFYPRQAEDKMFQLVNCAQNVGPSEP